MNPFQHGGDPHGSRRVITSQDAAATLRARLIEQPRPRPRLWTRVALAALPRRRLCGGAVCVALALASATVALASTGSTRSLAVTGAAARTVDMAALDARCGAVARRREPYPWPLRPFDQQHPVRGFFGDPRTISIDDPLAPPAPGDPGVFAFHNGVDIAGAPGEPVYPVVSGTVERKTPDELIVHGSGGRTFQYWHLKERAWSGEHVVAERTVLGTIQAVWGHVHLTEIRGVCVVNPLAPGHLTPFHDSSIARALAIEATAADGRPLDPNQLPTRFQLLARAAERPPLPSPGAWRDLPVTPALVEWRLTTAAGHTVVPTTVVADFRYTIPPNRDFWQIYGAGSHQNIVIGFDDRAFRVPGVYLFRLKGLPQPLRPGRYLIKVTVANVRGRRSSTAQPLTVEPDTTLDPQTVANVAPPLSCTAAPAAELPAESCRADALSPRV